MTDCHREDYAKEAYSDGKFACRDGHPMEANEFILGSLEHRAWENGWWNEYDAQVLKRRTRQKDNGQ